MSKYPPFERVTASKLVPGDHILIRGRADDQPIGRSHQLDPGWWLVTAVKSYVVQRSPRSQRWYQIKLRSNDAYEPASVTSSPIQRFNRIKS